MKHLFFLSLLFIFCAMVVYPQQFTITGKVTDLDTKHPLSFSNIRVMGTAYGASANVNGEYELKLSRGVYKLITSFIGYNSDTIKINVNQNLYDINFTLSQTKIDLPEIVVKPGVNPALEIISKAIEKKKIRNQELKSYEVEAYTKGIIRTTEDISAKSNSIGLGLGGSDTSKLIITGILENHSKGYFEQPNNFKEIILARKQSANFPPTINTLTGGRVIQNFYENNINFLGRDLPGPLSDKALEYYYYHIEKVTAKDNNKIYQIHMEPDNQSDPGFVGNIFIKDSSFDLVKVDLILNRAANTGGLFDTINVFQQFDEYAGIYLPVDYRLFVKANLLGLVRVGFELNTIFFDYKINQPLPDNIFNKAIVTVVPDADKKDSSYWHSTQTIPNTNEEQKAYSRIDSIEHAPKHFLDDFSPLSTRLNLTDNISISAPLGMYHFNRVEGHSIDFGIFSRNLFDKRLNSSLTLSYGFSDKKFKQDFNAEYLLGNYRTWKINFSAFNKIKVLFDESDRYGDFFSTLVTLISKNEFRDYYYSKGFGLGIEGEVFPVLRMRLGFKNKVDNSALVNSDFSIFNRDKTYKPNKTIYNSRINTVNIGFDIDFRDYIEDGYFRRRTSFGRSFILLSGDVIYSNKDFLKSDLNFTSYQFNTRVFLRTFNSAFLNLNIFTKLNDGTTAYQDLYALPGNIDVVFNSQTFRTLNINEVVGDKIVTINLTHEFRDEIFRLLNIPWVKNQELLFSLIFNAAYSDVTPESSAILTNPVKSFKHPFYEIGFGIGQGIIPFKLEFMWKLNYRDGNNFRVGLNMPLL